MYVLYDSNYMTSQERENNDSEKIVELGGCKGWLDLTGLLR